MLERLGEAYERVGNPEAAVEAWNEAMVERERAGDAVASARLRSQLALAEWNRGYLGIAEAHMNTGLAALAGLEPCQELADLLLVKSYILSRTGDVAGQASVAADLLLVAKRLESPRAEAEANLVAAHSSVWQRDITRARDHALRALMIGEKEQDLWIRCRAHLSLIMMDTLLGDHRLALSDAERGLAVAERLGSPNTEALLRVYLAHSGFIAGEWEDSISHCAEAVSLARRVGYPRDIAFSLAERAMILTFQGHLREAETCISEATSTFGGGMVADRVVFGLIDIAKTALALELGQGMHALDISRGFVCQPNPTATLAGLTIWLMPMGLMLLAEAQVAAGEPETALETAGKLSVLGPAGAPYLTALASRAEGLAYYSLGRWEDASASLIRAYELFTSLEIPFEAARSLLEHAIVIAPAQPELV
ncbi:MAG: hypothetical protein Q7O66_02940 [Dehalococcoidia bacterium]|nr:hypothetical protein [Dehalococcoidia bacterium]